MPESDDPQPLQKRSDAAARAFGPSRRLRSRTKVLPEHARSHNRALVLQTLYHEGPMSRADLARETGLTRVTISDLVAELIADEIVKELGVREASGPGKPATLVDIDRTGHRIVGIDMSGTTRFEGALMTLDGEVTARETIDRPDDDGEATLTATLELARRLIALAAQPILGVGIGTQGVVGADGVVLSSPNLGWHGLPLQATVSRELDLPVIVRNDANAAVLAEYTFGTERSDFMLVKIGTQARETTSSAMPARAWESPSPRSWRRSTCRTSCCRGPPTCCPTCSSRRRPTHCTPTPWRRCSTTSRSASRRSRTSCCAAPP